MLRSMSSVISGLNANQTALDVIGNNIANMQTISYKAQRIRFADNLSQTMASASAPGPMLGGTNGMQIGLGVKVAGIDTIMSQGNFEPTSRNLDCAIDGDGFFTVAEGPTLFDSTAGDKKETITVDSKSHSMIDNPRGANVLYTRDGSFQLDQQGNLLTSQGYRLLGYPMTNTQEEKDGVAAGKDVSSMGADGTINFVDANAVDDKKQSAIRVTQNTAGDHYTNELTTLRIPEKIKCPITDKDGKKTFNPDGTVGTDYKEMRVKSFSIDKNGMVKAVLEDGNTSVIGQLAITAFSNPAGLEKLGGNCYKGSQNSGVPVFKSGYVGSYNTANAADKMAKDSDNSKAFGSVVNGCLELSNVDIAEQFTKMIEATRAFQANGKMISTGDEILQDLVNLKR